MKKINKNNLEKLTAQLLAEKKRVITPVKDGEIFLYKAISAPEEMALEYGTARNSLKEFFVPQTEAVFGYEFAGEAVSLKVQEAQDAATVIIGGRPCDAYGLSIIDDVFAWDYKDEFYLKRRETAVIVSLACEKGCEGGFCEEIGISPFSQEGSDILLTLSPLGRGQGEGDGYLVEAVTEKGEKFIDKYKDYFETASEETLSADVKGQSEGKTNNILNLEKIKGWLDKNFEDEFWEEIAKSCLGCGVCTYLCPTCHCFDIVDEADWQKGERRRNWDACMFGSFTKMPSHQPRPELYRRYRQRVMHKFKYYADKFNKTACTGCGRCVRMCPVGIDIRKILQKIEKRN